MQRHVNGQYGLHYLPALWLLAGVSACGGAPPTAAETHTAYRELRIHEAALETAAARPAPSCDSRRARARDLCAAAEHICDVATALAETDAALRCERARRRCAEARPTCTENEP